MKRQFMPREWDYRSLDSPVTNVDLSNQQLANHAVARLRCSLTAGVDLCLMRIAGMLKANSPALIKSGAKVQDDTGHNGWVAAHVLPCGLICGDKPIHEIPKSQRMQTHIAEPYRYTNVVPVAANNADSRAERFKGRGLTVAFLNYAKRLIAITPSKDKKLDRSLLQSVYSQLFQDYLCIFEQVVASRSEQQYAGKSIVGGHVEIDLDKFHPTDKQNKEEALRMAVRLQLNTMRGLEGMGYSKTLVEDVEGKFHAAAGAM